MVESRLIKRISDALEAVLREEGVTGELDVRHLDVRQVVWIGEPSGSDVQITVTIGALWEDAPPAQG